MTTERAHRLFIRPTLDDLGERYKPALASPEAARLVVAIGLQESGLIETRQLRSDGRPRDDLARSWWQFEPGEGAALAGILRLPQTLWARHEIERMGYPLDWPTVWWAAAFDQRLGTVLARALLWSDPQPLPSDENAAWALYLRTWRPGRPRLEKWGENWRAAGEVANGAPAVVKESLTAQPTPPPQPGGSYVIARKRGPVPLYWTGSAGWPSGSTHHPNWDDRLDEARTFANREAAAAMIELWPALHGTQGHEVTIERAAEAWGE